MKCMSILSGKIIAGKYSSGDWLRQEDISTLLGVSQTPVREALDRLVATGLAERRPISRGQSADIGTEGNRRCILMRLILETTGARFAAKVILPEEVECLSSLVENTANLLTLEDMSVLRQMNKQFHTRIVEAAHSALLSKLYEMTTNAFPDWMLYEYMFRHPRAAPSQPKGEYDEHKAIVDALAIKDGR